MNGLSRRPSVHRFLPQSCDHRPGFIARRCPLCSVPSYHQSQTRLIASATAVITAAAVGVATPTFSTVTHTVAATTPGATIPGATTPTVVVRAIAAVAASLLAVAAFLLLLLRSRPQHGAVAPVVCHPQDLTRARVGAAFSWPFQELWSIADHAFRTEYSSAGCGDVILTDARRVEALTATSAPKSSENSTRGKGA